MLRRMVVIMGKLAIGSIIIVMVVDIMAVLVDRMLVESRLWSLRNDIEEVAEENNGIPYVYIEEFNARLDSIQDRSFIIEEVEHNMTSNITINSEIYDTVGTYEDHPDSDVRYYDYGEYMDIFLVVHYRYSTVASTVLGLVRDDTEEVTMDAVGERGKSLAFNQKRAYWSRVMASQDQR